MPIEQLAFRREGLRLFGGSAEPVVSAEILLRALSGNLIESFRPLLPAGYRPVVEAYKKAASELTVADLSHHYTHGLNFFHQTFAPYLKNLLKEITMGAWDLKDYKTYASGSDVDMIAHIIEAAASRGKVALFPGDWVGFEIGSTHTSNIYWQENSEGALACLCIPSVRNGHVTEGMVSFLEKADTCLLNLNLFPTLVEKERRQIARVLQPILPKTILSISFSRGFGLTASQLGVILVPEEHPWLGQFSKSWDWFTYFYNAIAAKAFMNVDYETLRKIDEDRRNWVARWLSEHNLPVVESGSYYVKSFQISEPVIPNQLKPLLRENIIRLCFKPPLEG